MLADASMWWHVLAFGREGYHLQVCASICERVLEDASMCYLMVAFANKCKHKVVCASAVWWHMAAHATVYDNVRVFITM